MAVCQAMKCRLIYRYRSIGIYTTFFEVSHFLLWRAGLPCVGLRSGPSKDTAIFLKELSVWIWGCFEAQRRRCDDSTSLLATTAHLRQTLQVREST